MPKTRKIKKKKVKVLKDNVIPFEPFEPPEAPKSRREAYVRNPVELPSLELTKSVDIANYTEEDNLLSIAERYRKYDRINQDDKIYTLPKKKKKRNIY